MTTDDTATRIDRLLDAIELIKLERQIEALPILRQLIQEDSDFEAAWLWMSVAVDSLDASALCLDNVLRINPDNGYAAGALFQLRQSHLAMAERRARLRTIRDVSQGLLWLLVIFLLFRVLTWGGAMLTG